MLHLSKPQAFAAALALAGLAPAQIASASPGDGRIMAETYVTASLQEDAAINHDRVKLQTKDPTMVRVQKLTFLPGAFTGWHHHPGAVVVAIASGSVTLTDGTCAATTYGPGLPNGSVFVEGHDEGHNAKAGDAGATVYVTYVSPDSRFRVEDAAVACD